MSTLRALFCLLLVTIFFTISITTVSAITIPNLGMNYTYYRDSVNGSDMSFASIALEYHKPGVRDIVKQELASLKNQRVETIRFFVNFASDASGHHWGLISSKTGKVPEPARTNYQQYFTDVKDAGITNLLIVFGPVWYNDPSSEGFTSELLEENWRFIQDVRSLAVSTWPEGGVTFDLSNEIGPQEAIKSLPQGEKRFNQTMQYITTIWQRYVNQYGSHDASFGAIAGATIKGTPTISAATSKTFDNLLSALQSSGAAMPSFFPVSLYAQTADETYTNLHYLDSVLTQKNLSASIRITESFYDHAPTAIGLKKYVLENRHPVTDYFYWPNNSDIAGGLGIFNIAPPFTITSYYAHLLPAGRLSCEPAQVTPDSLTHLGQAVIGIESANLDLYSANPTTQLCAQNSRESQPKVMGAWQGPAASTSMPANWIQGGVTYDFTLYAKSSLDCQGQVLDSCQVVGLSSRASDLNQDGRVDILDYNVLVSHFGRPYTIIDYNKLVSEFNKY